jgi:hypothetical protein
MQPLINVAHLVWFLKIPSGYHSRSRAMLIGCPQVRFVYRLVKTFPVGYVVSLSNKEHYL